MSEPTLEHIVATLLSRAGIFEPPTSIETMVSKGVTNLMSVVTLQNEERFILRQYRWPWGNITYDRLHKEVSLHRVLQEHGVPVPKILATLPEHSAALMEYVPGRELADIMPSLPARAREQAWRSCGEMLQRAHTITYPEGTYGVINGEQVQTFADFFAGEGPWAFDAPTWGHFQVGMILHYYRRLIERKFRIDLKEEEFCSFLEAYLPLLNRTLPTFLHNDTDPSNVFVRETRDGWQCAAWLDWEYAWVGDPTWDLAHLQVARHQLDPLPEAFWEGYGRPPQEPECSLYEMHILLWRANDYIGGDVSLPAYATTMRYASQLDVAVRKIKHLL